ncbi:PadR family transcriptional regulator [Clavibacter michiganensis]|uniref:PadR family transcriptional regulator n=1 Tax=Clavibacter michiganensis TaxID=28447 RepID=UPI00280BDC01|nr:PadR family transcriptional regulator [Clavibacter michiganensis]
MPTRQHPPERSFWNKAVLSLLVLHAIYAFERAHGYKVVSYLRDELALDVRGGTVYPLLNALETQGLLASIWLPGSGGPGRKEYYVTPDGKMELDRSCKTWFLFSETVSEALIKTAKEGGQ